MVLLLKSVGARITTSIVVIVSATIVRLLRIRHLVLMSRSSVIVAALFLIVAIVIVISLLIATIASLIVIAVLVRHPVVALKSIISVASLEALAVTLLGHRLILQDGLWLGLSILSE